MTQIPFDAVAWKRADPIKRDRTVRSQMIDDLLGRYNFQGWTEQQIVQLLGEPDSRLGFERYDIVYKMGLERGGSFSLDTEALVSQLDRNDRVFAYHCHLN